MTWDVLGYKDFGMGLLTNWDFPFTELDVQAWMPFTLRVECIEGGTMVDGVFRYPNVLGIIGRFRDYTSESPIRHFLDSKKVFYGSEKTQVIAFEPYGQTFDMSTNKLLPGGASYEYDPTGTILSTDSTINTILGFKCSKIKKGTRPVTVNFPDDYSEVRQSWWFDQDIIGFTIRISIWRESVKGMNGQRRRSSWDRAHNFVYVMQGLAHAVAPFCFIAAGLTLVRMSQVGLFDNAGEDDLRTIAAGLFGSATSYFLTNRSTRRSDIRDGHED